jgi:hypothetical protein
VNWSRVLLIASAVGLIELLAFVALYGIRSNWRAYPAGRALMGLVGMLAAMFGLLFLGRVVDGLGFFVWSLVLIAFDVVIGRWLVLLWRAQRTSNKDSRPGGNQDARSN